MGHGYSDMTLALIAVRDHRDKQAFARLFSFYAPRLKTMLIRGGLRDGSTEDVIQDVMLTVWHKAHQFDPHRAEASAWIYRIARNRQIDLSRKTPLAASADVEEIECNISDDPDASQILAMKQEVDLLRKALGQLTPEQSVAVEQAYLYEMAHSEISVTTGLPLGTIKSRIRLGLARLRGELKDLQP